MSIEMSDSIKEICESICNFQKNSVLIPKNGRNVSQNYDYAKFEDFMETIKKPLSDNGLFTTSSITDTKRLKSRTTRNGSLQHVTQVTVCTALFHKSGEWMKISCPGEGQDSGDKAIYKAITGARKYALACLLGLATTDDPEESKPIKISNEMDKEIFDNIKNTLHSAKSIEKLSIAWNLTLGKKMSEDQKKEIIDLKEEMKKQLKPISEISDKN